MISMQHLTVRRSATFSVRIAELTIPAGHILCVTGANGSGKTTLIECMAGLLAPSRGTIRVAEHNPMQSLQHMRLQCGYIPDDEEWFIAGLCAKEYFDLLMHTYSKAGCTKNMPARLTMLQHALSFTALSQPLTALSHGNKKKVQIIASLLHEPSIIIADEIRNGLDPLAITVVEQLIRDEAARGACIIVSTHDLWWAERIADSALLLSRGEPYLHLSMNKVKQRYGSLETAFLRSVGQS